MRHSGESQMWSPTFDGTIPVIPLEQLPKFVVWHGSKDEFERRKANRRKQRASAKSKAAAGSRTPARGRARAVPGIRPKGRGRGRSGGQRHDEQIEVLQDLASNQPEGDSEDPDVLQNGPEEAGCPYDSLEAHDSERSFGEDTESEEAPESPNEEDEQEGQEDEAEEMDEKKEQDAMLQGEISFAPEAGPGVLVPPAPGDAAADVDIARPNPLREEPPAPQRERAPTARDMRSKVTIQIGRHGHLTYHPKLQVIQAFCSLRDGKHAEDCRISRSVAGKRAAGRPIGDLCAWLQAGSQYDNRYSHVHFCKPSLAERQSARAFFCTLDGAAAFAAYEKEKSHAGDPDEPEIVG